jgi:copper(I)-binding protein
MKTLLLVAVVAATAAAVLFLQPPVSVGNSYVEVVPPDLALVGFTFANWGLRPVCITDVEAPPGLVAELHVTEFNGTVAVMKTVDEICVGPFSTVRFGSLTYHVMLVGNVSQIGKDVKIVLQLSDGRKIALTAVRGVGGVHVHG